MNYNLVPVIEGLGLIYEVKSSFGNISLGFIYFDIKNRYYVLRITLDLSLGMEVYSNTIKGLVDVLDKLLV